MKNSLQKTAILMSIMALSATTVWAATDYSAMSNEELSAVRGTLHSSSQEERNAFRTEWQQRVQKMTPEEQQQYIGHAACRAAGDTERQQGKGHGRGHGRQHGMANESQ